MRPKPITPVDLPGLAEAVAVHKNTSDGRASLAPGPLVEVTWSDSAGRSDWHSPDDARRCLDEMDCISAGYMATDDERGILLVMGAGAVGSWLSSMAIPRHAIKEVRRLEKAA